MAPRRDVARLVAARFISRAGSEAAFFVGVWGKAAYELHATAGELAILMFVLSVSMMLGSTISGVLIDRYGPRRVLVFAEIVFVIAAIAVMLADSLPVLAVLVSVWALVGSPVVTAGASFAPYLARDEQQLAKVNSLVEGGGSLAFAVGPAVGALIVTYAHVNWVFVIDAVTSLVAAILVSRISLQPPVRQATEASPFAEFRDGVRTAYRLRPVRYYLLLGTVAWLSFGAFGSLEPLFFRDVVGTGIETLGWMNSLFGLGFIVGAATLPRLPGRIVSARGLAAMITLVGLGTVLYVGSTDLRIIGAGAFVWAFVIGITEPLLRTLMHRDSPRAAIGRVMGTAEVHRRAGELIPLAFAPTLATLIGVQPALIGFGVVASLLAVGSAFEARAIDRRMGERDITPADIEAVPLVDEPISPTP